VIEQDSINGMNAFLFIPNQNQRRKQMNQQNPTEQLQEKDCAALEDRRLSAAEILSEQADDAHENEDHASLFVP
jgi:hypothetical protein